MLETFDIALEIVKRNPEQKGFPPSLVVGLSGALILG